MSTISAEPRTCTRPPRSPEHIKNLKAALKAKWASGTRKPTPRSAYEKASASIKKAWSEGRVKMPSKEVLAERGRAGGKAKSTKKDTQIRALGKAKKGVPNSGRNAAIEENIFAHHWIIRSPRGVIYEFTNLALWARNNDHLFLPDDRPTSKLPLSRRIKKGIGMLYEVNGKCCSYKGWTAVSRVELINGGGDLLGRDTSIS